MKEKDLPHLKIDIVSDVVCPWCYIGYKQLEKALDLLQEHLALEIEWHPFELNPGMPHEGEDINDHIARKYGAQPEQMNTTRRHMMALAEGLGIELNYSPGRRIYNTFDAHRILHWAREQSCQTSFSLALFHQYFSLGRNPSEPEVLLDVARELALDHEEILRILESDRYVQTVREELNRYTSMGIQGVPTFIIENKYSITGAQDPETFARVLNKIQQEAA